jgi:2'-5' RNA ligase
MSEWANWQESFRHGVLVIVPPARVRRTVDGLRAEYDPTSHSYFGTHITLTQPLVRQPREDDWARLVQTAAGFDAFRIEYGPLGSFLPYPCIWFRISPKERVLAIRQAFHDGGLFDLGLPHTNDFVPHMTITEGSSSRKVDEGLLAELRGRSVGGFFTCREIAYIIPDSRFRFAVRRTLKLRRRAKEETSQGAAGRANG